MSFGAAAGPVPSQTASDRLPEGMEVELDRALEPVDGLLGAPVLVAEIGAGDAFSIPRTMALEVPPGARE